MFTRLYFICVDPKHYTLPCSSLGIAVLYFGLWTESCFQSLSWAGLTMPTVTKAVTWTSFWFHCIVTCMFFFGPHTEWCVDSEGGRSPWHLCHQQTDTKQTDLAVFSHQVRPVSYSQKPHSDCDTCNVSFILIWPTHHTFTDGSPLWPWERLTSVCSCTPAPQHHSCSLLQRSVQTAAQGEAKTPSHETLIIQVRHSRVWSGT